MSADVYLRWVPVFSSPAHKLIPAQRPVMVRLPASDEERYPLPPPRLQGSAHSEGGGGPRPSRDMERKPSPGAFWCLALNLASSGEDHGDKDGHSILHLRGTLSTQQALDECATKTNDGTKTQPQVLLSSDPTALRRAFFSG